jgi:tetratricopeptide (TPR) repeat protein
MAQFQDQSQSPGGLSLAELLARYLHGQAEVHEAGLAAVPGGEVVPHEAAPTPSADPKLAWEETLAIMPFCAAKIEKKSLKPPADWPALVAAQEPALAVAFCLGNFPQMVRSLQALLHSSKLEPAMVSNSRLFESPELIQWATQTAGHKDFPGALMAVAALRLAKEFDRAQQLFPKEADVPTEWRSAWANERAALAWHRGQTQEALAFWQSQEETVPVLFNRGMACLFLSKRADARAFLQKAVDQLPEDGAWHHLGRLYLALAEMRS